MDYLAPLGPVYQAGTLSGNPLAMAAGIAALKLLESDDSYARLSRLGAQIQGAVSAALKAKGLAAQVPQSGSMWCTYFTPEPVRDLTTAQTTDAELFARYFRACLERGVYLPPSAFEACFISTAHEGASIDQACEVISSVIKDL